MVIKFLRYVLTQDDYKSLTDADDLEVLQSSDFSKRQQAEIRAQGFMSGYLRSRYDVEAIFAASGEARDANIIGYMVDIVLYDLCASIPGRFVSETRKERYKDAKSWLKDVQNGQFDLELPLKDDDDSGNPIQWGSSTKQTNDW
ncbi:MAG: DUF1320 family protein [Bacteroidales bacterium]|nr:DUF1320 family protein [Bacteroidales bacterium]